MKIASADFLNIIIPAVMIMSVTTMAMSNSTNEKPQLRRDFVVIPNSSIECRNITVDRIVHWTPIPQIPHRNLHLLQIWIVQASVWIGIGTENIFRWKFVKGPLGFSASGVSRDHHVVGVPAFADCPGCN